MIINKFKKKKKLSCIMSTTSSSLTSRY